eukprot:768697-Hanusia_phi.AAC.6
MNASPPAPHQDMVVNGRYNPLHTPPGITAPIGRYDSSTPTGRYDPGRYDPSSTPTGRYDSSTPTGRYDSGRYDPSSTPTGSTPTGRYDSSICSTPTGRYNAAGPYLAGPDDTDDSVIIPTISQPPVQVGTDDFVTRKDFDTTVETMEELITKGNARTQEIKKMGQKIEDLQNSVSKLDAQHTILQRAKPFPLRR